MLTIILPGYSIKNKEWVEETKDKLDTKGKIIAYKWKHWETEKPMDMKKEVLEILQIVGKSKVNFIAKSVGTEVLMKLLPSIYKQVNKVILCGIPIDPLTYVKPLKILSSNNILIIQNSKDPFMPYSLVKKYIYLIDKNIKVIKKESNTHHYPYIEEFRDFLLS